MLEHESSLHITDMAHTSWQIHNSHATLWDNNILFSIVVWEWRTNNVTHHICIRCFKIWLEKLLDQEFIFRTIWLNCKNWMNSGHCISYLVLCPNDLIKGNVLKVLLKIISHYFIWKELVILIFVLIIHLLDNKLWIPIDKDICNIPLNNCFETNDETFILSNLLVHGKDKLNGLGMRSPYGVTNKKHVPNPFYVCEPSK